MLNPLIGMPQGAEWLIILAIVILVFGAAKLPALARSTGQSLRIFKAETKGLREDDAKDETTPPRPLTPGAEVPPATPVVPPVVPTTEPLPSPSEQQTDTRNS